MLAAEEVTFEEAAPDLRDELARARARREIDRRSDEITDLMAGGAALEDLAERSGMLLDQIEWTAETTGGITDYAPFREAAAAAQEGAFPELMVFEDGGVFARALDAVTAPALRPLDEVRDEVIADIEAETRARLRAERAETLAARIAAGESFEAAGLAPQAASNLTRRSFVEGTSPAFIREVFALEEGEIRAITDEGFAAVVRLDATHPPAEDDEGVVAERQAIEERLGTGLAQDIYAAFATAVQSQTEIRIDDAAVQAVHSSFR